MGPANIWHNVIAFTINLLSIYLKAPISTSEIPMLKFTVKEHFEIN